MARQLTGLDLLLLLRGLDRDELTMPARDLLELYDRPLCEDCRRHHDDVWAAIACDELTDARARREIAHQIRTSQLRRCPTSHDEDLVELAQPV